MKNFAIPSPQLCFLLVGTAMISVTNDVSATLQERLEEADLESPDAIRNTTRSIIQEKIADIDVLGMGMAVTGSISMRTAGTKIADRLQAISTLVISEILEATGGTPEAAEAAAAGAMEAALSIDQDKPSLYPNLVGMINPNFSLMVKNTAKASMIAVESFVESADLTANASVQLMEASSRGLIGTAIEGRRPPGLSAADLIRSAEEGIAVVVDPDVWEVNNYFDQTVEVEDLENLEEEEVTDPVTDEEYFSP